jgi:hypothetical protein
MKNTKKPDELEAMRVLVEQLEPLDAAARVRALKYLVDRLEIQIANVRPPEDDNKDVNPDAKPQPFGNKPLALTDLRSLVAEKQPASAIEMAVLTAYYLKEVASAEGQKDAITVADIERYFKQGGYPLPKVVRFALTNAKDAGYFESAGRGLYKLTPVGYNLAAHKMPTRAEKRK